MNKKFTKPGLSPLTKRWQGYILVTVVTITNIFCRKEARIMSMNYREMTLLTAPSAFVRRG